MSFLTEYFDEFREHPIKVTKPCTPETFMARIAGNWIESTPGSGSGDKEMTDEEIRAFIKKAMKSIRGQSTYYEYCEHHSEDFKTRKLIPRPKIKKCKDKVKTKKVEIELAPCLALKDTEVMKSAKALYEKDLHAASLEPLRTSTRILGYMRPQYLKTGLSEYKYEICRLAYEMVRDDKIPRYVAHNGARPRWGYPPEGTRQPETDGAPYDGERLY